MSYSREELEGFIREKIVGDKVVAIEQAQIKKARAKSAAQLTIDPRWTVFVHELEKDLEQKNSAAQTCAEILTRSGILEPTAYGNLKLDQIRNQSFVEGLQRALDIVKWALEDGEKALAILKVVDNKT